MNEPRARRLGTDATATGIDPLADGAESEDPIDSGLDDVGGLRNDATCVVPWVADGFQAIEVYLDPIIDNRTESICETVTAWSAEHRDLDALAGAVMGYASEEDLSASIFPHPRDELSVGVVAIAFTVG